MKLPQFTLRDLFTAVLVVGLLVAYYLSHQTETRLRHEVQRLDWKSRLQTQLLRHKGITIADDGKAISVTSVEGKAKYTPQGFESWSAEGSHAVATWKSPPYSWPPAAKE